MSPANNLSEKAQKILAQFPGPATLYRSKSKWLGMLISSVVMIALGSWGIFWGLAYEIDKHHPGWLILLVYALLEIFLIGFGIWSAFYIALPTLALWGGRGSLLLDRTGFRCWRRRTSFVNWHDATNFKPLLWLSRKKIVFYKEENPPANFRGLPSRFAKQNVNCFLGDTFGLDGQDLANLMDAWRERALAEKNKTYGSSSVSQ